ncbi:hypothetical protein [Neisseria musculi]|uniref:Secreted protein n=1 Tax=Neisseria musculi TaxID=1815583 RepID=A0A7H1M814_9NEIS|nr:hypothetical protein [Neisseria musculi]QNT57779.1 hypothetical protein H7A79_2439 [Neisseria musculi]
MKIKAVLLGLLLASVCTVSLAKNAFDKKNNECEVVSEKRTVVEQPGNSVCSQREANAESFAGNHD